MTAPGAQSSSMSSMSRSETWPCEGIPGSGCQSCFAQLVVGCHRPAGFRDLDTEPRLRRFLAQPIDVDLRCPDSLHGLLPIAEGSRVRVVEEALDLVMEGLEASGVGRDVEENRPEGRTELRHGFAGALASCREPSRIDAFQPD